MTHIDRGHLVAHLVGVTHAALGTVGHPLIPAARTGSHGRETACAANPAFRAVSQRKCRELLCARTSSRSSMRRLYAAATAVVHDDGHLQERGSRPTSLGVPSSPRKRGGAFTGRRDAAGRE